MDSTTISAIPPFFRWALSVQTTPWNLRLALSWQIDGEEPTDRLGGDENAGSALTARGNIAVTETVERYDGFAQQIISTCTSNVNSLSVVFQDKAQRTVDPSSIARY